MIEDQMTSHEQQLSIMAYAVSDYMTNPPQIIDSTLLDLISGWSEVAFGPGLRTDQVIKHIESELNEIRQDPMDLEEWVDVILLAINGASRTGVTGNDIINAIKHKVRKNCMRVWPDWRDVPEGQPIEHIKQLGENGNIE